MKCVVNKCDHDSLRHGYCAKHYKRLIVHGDVNYTEKVYDHPEICTVKGCTNKYKTKGFCDKHYQRFFKFGDPLKTERKYEPEYHGLRGVPEYQVWAGMKARCNNVKHFGYKRYGGRGISVCERWSKSFLSFYNDMGPRPSSNYQIDRIDTNGNYEPSNCRWSSVKENNRNRRNTKLSRSLIEKIKTEYKPGIITHKELSVKYGVSKSHITAIINGKKWNN
jgi:hypothetical protein